MRAGARLAFALTLGLLGWELGLLGLLSPGPLPGLGVLGARLVRDAALLLPVVFGAVGWTRVASRREGAEESAWERARRLSTCFLVLLTAMTVSRSLLGNVPAAGASEDEARFLCAAVRPGEESRAEISVAEALGTGARDALLLQVPVLPLSWLLLRRPPRTSLARGASRASLALGGLLGLTCLQSSDERPGPEAEGCPPGVPVRRYAVAAIAADIPLNAEGDHLPQGLAYVLEEALPGSEGAPLQPLVVRANLGECLELRFTNRRATGVAALRLEGLRATVRGAGQGGRFVPGTAVEPGQRFTSVLVLPSSPEAEGAYLLHDAADGGERERRGLFGALVLEPAGAVYRDPTTGEPLVHGAGEEALVSLPSGAGFRERVLLHQALGLPEEVDVRTARGALLPVLDEMAGPFRAGAYGFNYRSEPRFEREEEDEAEPLQAVRGPAIFRSYLGEAVKLRGVPVGSAELHLLHVHGWSEHRGPRARPSADSSFEQPRVLTPGGGFTLTPSGAEPFPPAAGDFLIHCHMPNHSTGGERLTWRVFSEPQPRLVPVSPRDP